MAINLDEIAKKYGGTSSVVGQDFSQTASTKVTSTGFGRRLALSFGGKEADEERAQIEQQLGTAGKFDVGDIADVAGKALPLAGSIAGGITGFFGAGVGAIPGAAGGAAGGEALRRSIGGLLGVNKDSAGENVKEVVKEGAYTYAGGKVLSTAGKALSKTGLFTKIPERLYSTFFKTTSDDMANLARTGAIQNLSKSNPEMYQQLVKEGIIRTGKSGVVELNPTLAQEALERGLGAAGKGGGKNTWGGLEGMAKYTIQRQMEQELAARQLVRSIVKPLKIENYKGYISMIKDVNKSFKGEGYGFLKDAIKESNDLAKILAKGKGRLSAENTLKLRRLIDSLRNTSSFRNSPTLTSKQAIFKSGADKLRAKLAELPGMKDIMNEYRFNIEAAESLVNEAAKRGNTRILSLFDAVVGGSSIASFGPAGLTLWAGLRTAQTPAILTAIARGLKAAPEAGMKSLPFLSRPAGQAVEGIVE